MAIDQIVQVAPDSTGKRIDNSEVVLSVPSTVAQWLPTTSYAVGAIVQPVPPNGHSYVCTAAGVSGATQPTFPTAAISQVTDGTTLVWTERSTVERQRVNLADPTNPAGLQAVVNTLPPPYSYGGVVYLAVDQLPVPTADQNLLASMVVQDDGTSILPTIDNLAYVGGVDFALGQASMAKSLPVALASDQPPLSVSLTSPIPAASFATSGLALEAGNLAALVGFEQTQIIETLTAILVELRTLTYFISQGLNMPDDPDLIRYDSQQTLANSNPPASPQPVF